jgi:hypothetical protein
MNKTILLLLAAVILISIGIAHSYLGERYVFGRLFALRDLPLLHHGRRYTEMVIRFAWHLTSVAWWGFAAVIIALSNGLYSAHVVGGIVGCTLLLTGTIIIVTAGIRHPAWWAFLVAGALTVFATW